MPIGEEAGLEDCLERRLVEAVRRGDSGALAELMGRCGPWVRGAIFAAGVRADAVEDVLQQVWLAAWRRAGDLDDPGRWRAWLYTLARHAAIDATRRQRRAGKLLDAVRSWWSSDASDAGEPVVAMVAAEQHQRALRAVAGLPEIYRQPFVLRHLADWSYRQIAEALELPLDTVETRLVRARKLLRGAMARER
jgi:RNA polymerase sigma-70 factor (ECF subfamily)